MTALRTATSVPLDGTVIVYCDGSFGTPNGKTAHGLVRFTYRYDVAAVVTISTIEIGRIRVDDVEAVVLGDQSLRNTLIGMNMLKQFARFEVKNEVLYIEQ